MKNKLSTFALSATLAVSTLSLSVDQAEAVQPAVNLPSGLNLGATSFYDGFGGRPGDSTWQIYAGFSQAEGIKDQNGNNIPIVNDAKIDVYTLISQYNHVFDTERKVLGGHLGMDFIVPMASLDARFKAGPPYPGLQLKDDGFGLGDPTASLFIQYEPMTIDGNPFFVSRLSAGFAVPVGKYDKDKDFNIGNNAWSFQTYLAMTFLLSPEWSISLRPQYYYNFKNTDPAGSLPLDAGVRHTQAGQSASMNYNVGYRLNDAVTIGISGYYLKQLTDDKINGSKIKNSKEQALGFGPGVLVDLDRNKFFLTAYRETKVENRFEINDSIIFRWLHTF